MKRFIISILSFVIAFFNGNALDAEKKQEKSGKSTDEGKKVKAMEEKKIILSRSEVAEKLKKLKEKPKPQNLAEGAMCYKVAGPPDRIDYICPVCGHKTVYTSSHASFLHHSLNQARSMITVLKQFGISLDESQFCSKCTVNVKNPALCLVISYKDEAQPHKSCGISSTDLKLLGEFFAGKDKHTDGNDFESPLIDHLGRIEELLGIKSK